MTDFIISAVVNDEVQVVTIAQQGPAGPQGIQGSQGAQGVQGIQGIQGIQGPIGISQYNIDGGNASSIYTIEQVIDGGGA